MKVIHCCDCNRKLTNDEVAVNIKLLGKCIGTFRCKHCLSAALGCELEKMSEMIAYFKNSGCILFQTLYTD